MLLDEPTSALDSTNEKKIIKTILNLSNNIIVIMASHKLDFIPNDIRVGHLINNSFEIKKIKDFIKKD